MNIVNEIEKICEYSALMIYKIKKGERLTLPFSSEGFFKI